MFLPTTAKVHFTEGQIVKAGEVFANLIDMGRKKRAIWAKKDLKFKWNDVKSLFRGPSILGYAQKLWFEAQGRLMQQSDDWDLYAYPIGLLGEAKGKVDESGLWWDFSKLKDRLNEETQSIVLPPIRQRKDDNFKYTLPGSNTV